MAMKQKTYSELNYKVEQLQKQVVDSIRSFFRNSEEGMYVLRNQVSSTLNGDIDLKGFSVEHDGIYLIGENGDGLELHEDNLHECNLHDLIYCLGELENKFYDFQAD